MAKYRKKPVVVEAIQWTGSNIDEIQAFISQRLEIYVPPKGYEKEYQDLNPRFYSIFIPTVIGKIEATKGDWIIKDASGSVHPCKQELFEMTYELDQ